MTKILVADDSTFMRQILMNILKKEGYTNIVEATNGIEAFEGFKSQRPDLVLLDIIMEKEDGIEALKQIKDLDKNAKVIIVSAVGQEKMIKEAITAGAEDFIVKPFNAEKVAQTVKKVLF